MKIFLQIPPPPSKPRSKFWANTPPLQKRKIGLKGGGIESVKGWCLRKQLFWFPNETEFIVNPNLNRQSSIVNPYTYRQSSIQTSIVNRQSRPLSIIDIDRQSSITVNRVCQTPYKVSGLGSELGFGVSVWVWVWREIEVGLWSNLTWLTCILRGCNIFISLLSKGTSWKSRLKNMFHRMHVSQVTDIVSLV